MKRVVGSGGESDEEHSLGSCSAEVAAINSPDKRRRTARDQKEKEEKKEPKK